MWGGLDSRSRYIATPTVAKHRLFVWYDARIIGGCAPAEPLRLPESAQDHEGGSRTTGRGR